MIYFLPLIVLSKLWSNVNWWDEREDVYLFLGGCLCRPRFIHSKNTTTRPLPNERALKTDLGSRDLRRLTRGGSGVQFPIHYQRHPTLVDTLPYPGKNILHIDWKYFIVAIYIVSQHILAILIAIFGSCPNIYCNYCNILQLFITYYTYKSALCI